MPRYRILHSYADMIDSALGDFALHIASQMTGNANFPTPPFTPASLTTAANNYIGSLSAAINGTPTATATKNALQASLIGSLDQLANYVELVSLNDQVKMLSSGFSLASTARTTAVPGTTSILAVTNLGTGRLRLKLAASANAWCFIVETSSTPGVWTTAGVFTDPKGVVLTGLLPGTTYAIRVKVMGSKNQTSEWSGIVSQMST